jgi:hypothetical protein
VATQLDGLPHAFTVVREASAAYGACAQGLGADLLMLVGKSCSLSAVVKSTNRDESAHPTAETPLTREARGPAVRLTRSRKAGAFTSAELAPAPDDTQSSVAVLSSRLVSAVEASVSDGPVRPASTPRDPRLEP